MDDGDLAKRFEDLVAELFTAEGFSVEREPQPFEGVRPDLLIRSPRGATAIVEIKLYRSRAVPISALSQAALIIEFARPAFNANRAILVIGSKVSHIARDTVKSQFPNVVIYDVNALAFLVVKHPALITTFENITREALTFSEATEPQPVATDIEADISAPEKGAPVSRPTMRDGRGHHLCLEIRKIQAGKEQARQFEEKVSEALQYIFDEDLTAWAPQEVTETKLSRYDLVARVASTHDFWNMIVSEFHSRYIVLEFKNYRERIKQGQIYTTEKYLFRSALRSMAILISRSGADKNALAAARGALRESGKLIVNLDLEDLCKMLSLKDRGNDHNAVLVEIVDDMLMQLER